MSAAEPPAKRRLGRSSVEVTRVGLGTAALGGWPHAIPVAQAIATIDRAWEHGVRYFDTAPFYGHGRSESNLAVALAERDTADFVLSTKVGRVLDPGPAPDPLYEDAAPFTPRFDFTRDGVLRALDGSRNRLGAVSIDVALIHDPDDYLDQALRETYPLLRDLRAEGVLRAIGVGMQWSAPLTRFAMEADIDCCMVAGRYTLLEQPALDDLFPVALERGISVIVGGALNSGLLVNPGPGSYYNYAPAPDAVVSRAQAIETVCRDFGVPLRAAALQFALAHPAVTSLVAGACSPDEVDDTFAMLDVSIPSDVWVQLKERELLREDAPTPA